ncbi:MAG: CapA family protein [Lachnospiraceae bacterium]|nr:CapA family protein [Lachnospiraceae bacterium]
MKSFLKGTCIGLAIGLCLFIGYATYFMISDSESTTAAAPPAAVSIETSEETEPVPDKKEVSEPEPVVEEKPAPEPMPVRISFAGDVQFSEQYLSDYDQKGISALTDTEMLSLMQDSDLFLLNEEFPFSLRGEPMPDKQFTFRTDPKYVKILQELGTDIVTVANNHALDFGMDAFCDTLDTLNQADITYIGGGYDITEASAAAVRTIEGQTFAFLGATRVSPSYSWYANSSQPGLFQTYDPAGLNEAIKTADAAYDHVIVFVHWGIERNDIPEEYQRVLAKGYIDAGADLIVGCHPHVLQGFEYYKNVPIVYSLGNYLFGNRTGETLLLQAVFSPEGTLDIELVPCQRKNGVLSRIQEPAALYDYLNSISFDAKVSGDGLLTP